MASTSHDPQRWAVYMAEDEVFFAGNRFIRPLRSLDEVAAFVGKVISGSWWVGPDFVEIMYTPSREYAQTYKMSPGHAKTEGVIELPRWGWTKPVVLHELAHLNGPESPQGHGPAYARRLLQAHELYGSKREAKWLAEAFKERGVRAR